jgi:predicted transposase/invertase (TIGR01784 family)
MTMNLTQLYSRQLNTGIDFTQLKEVISFWLMDKNMFNNTHWLHVVRLHCPEDNLDFIDDLRIIVVELPKWLAGFNKSHRPVSELDPLEQWLYLLTHTDGRDTREIIGSLGGTVFKEALDIMSEFTTRDRLRHAYQMRQNYKSIVTTERNEAIREGEAKGKLETARELKKIGVALEIIEKATGLERGQLERL